MKKNKGFTLAELMIALAVIGILVAVVTPAIMKTRPNKNKMMIKKTFYATEQIVSTLINDEVLYPDGTSNCNQVCPNKPAECRYGFDDTSNQTVDGQTFGGNDKFWKLFKSKLNVNDARGGNEVFYTNDGVQWNLADTVGAWNDARAPYPLGSGGESCTNPAHGTIVIDVNGDDAPNAYQNGNDDVDFDRYRIDIYANGKMRINDEDRKAREFVTINTSIRDNLE